MELKIEIRSVVSESGVQGWAVKVISKTGKMTFGFTQPERPTRKEILEAYWQSMRAAW